MPRITRHFWLCPNNSCYAQNSPGSRICGGCGWAPFQSNAQVRESERAVVYQHPDGRRVTPARADQGMPEIYQRQGFERREVESMIAFEKETGLVHESSNWTPGNESIGELPKAETPKEIVDDLVKVIRDAKASGQFTTREGQAQFGVDLPIGL
jgi:hypothetical protein